MQDNDLPQIGTPMQTDETRKINLASALVVVGLCASESESKRLIRGGGVYVNREKAADNGYVRAGDLISAGKKHHATLTFAAPPAVEREGFDGAGFVYWNPDSGEEYAPNHPINSGECVEAEKVRRSTPQEDALHAAYQEQWKKAQALATVSKTEIVPTLHPSDREAIRQAVFRHTGCSESCADAAADAIVELREVAGLPADREAIAREALARALREAGEATDAQLVRDGEEHAVSVDGQIALAAIVALSGSLAPANPPSTEKGETK